MAEHGVLKRVLLIYQEALRRVEDGQAPPVTAIHNGAEIIHDFIESFHEALEEGYVFPRLRSAGKLVSTVDTLLVQHGRGRELTQLILEGSTSARMNSMATRKRVTSAMSAFVRMYEPHEAREDTVVFPVYRQLLGGRSSTHSRRRSPTSRPASSGWERSVRSSTAWLSSSAASASMTSTSSRPRLCHPEERGAQSGAHSTLPSPHYRRGVPALSETARPTNNPVAPHAAPCGTNQPRCIVVRGRELHIWGTPPFELGAEGRELCRADRHRRRPSRP